MLYDQIEGHIKKIQAVLSEKKKNQTKLGHKTVMQSSLQCFNLQCTVYAIF